MDYSRLAPSASLLLAAVALDAILGDPRFALHPIRLMGRTLSVFESRLREVRWNGYLGGVVLFLLLSLVWVVVPSILVARLGWIAHLLTLYFLIALRDLFDHVRTVGAAANRNELTSAREAIGRLVGRDTSRMDLHACRRAAIESLSENFVDGFLSAIFWYVLLGIPGLLLFKVVSTMDSMVGYKTPAYLQFGWCGARLDDAMNYVPARLAWPLLSLTALPFPGLSVRKGFAIGWSQHSILPGPNPGWSEATMAGALQRRLIGPIWKDGQKVTEIWIGDPTDPEGGSSKDLARACQVIALAAIVVVAVSAMLLA